MKKTPQFELAKKIRIITSPGPQKYFKTPKFSPERKSESPKKKHEFDDKKCFKPMNKILF